MDDVSTSGQVREWRDDEGWGVIDSPETPGGCWVHYSHLLVAGYKSLAVGDQVELVFEAPGQDGYPFRAVEVWPAGQVPVRTRPEPPGPGSFSTLTISGHRVATTTLEDARQVAFVGVSDLDSAQHFYGDVLGLELSDARPYALVHETRHSQLRITRVDEVQAAPYTVLGWVVADLEAEIGRLLVAGVTFNRYDGMEQDALGIWTAPSGARIAWFHDPDGNNLSLQA